jgi:hypothetical protein
VSLPQNIRDQAARMPRESHALFVVINGEPQNAEFCVWGKDDFLKEWWKWRNGTRPNMQGKNVEYWAKMGREFVRVNPDAVG